MDETDWLTERFQVSRPRLRAVAYRMLGSDAEADDAVQETWLRLDRTDAGSVENLSGWLTTVVARVCLDRLRSRRLRREDLAGDDLEGLAGVGDEDDPAEHALLADSVGSALLVVLDMLTPAERVAFVLHDIFAVPYEEIGQIIDRSSDASRQIASRARRRLQGAPAVPDLDLTVRRELVEAFFAAARAGDFDALLAYLDPNVVVRGDAAAMAQPGGSRAMRAKGAEEVAAWGLRGVRGGRVALVDGVANFVWAPQGKLRGVADFTIVDGKIVEIYLIADPERIRQLDIVVLDG